MAEAKTFLLSQHQEFDARRVVPKLLHDSEKCRVVLFCLEPQQEIPPHESSSEVLLYGVEGAGTASVGKDQVGLEPGTLVVCPPGLPHGIKAIQRTVILAVIAPRPQ